jgi:hypothetical protein
MATGPNWETTMKRELFDAVDPCLDEFAELLDTVLEGEASAKFREALAELSGILGKGYFVGLNIVVDVFDEEGEKSLPLLTTGLAVSHGQEPFRTWGDSSPQRYVLDGEMVTVPDDRCPKCWEVWDFKWLNPTCPHCDATLGANVRILLDSDTCPFCEKGKVTMTAPTCDKCGHEVDPRRVVWG